MRPGELKLLAQSHSHWLYTLSFQRHSLTAFKSFVLLIAVGGYKS